MKLWDAFLEDYRKDIDDWSLRYTLEVFWHYCQDGSRAVENFRWGKKPTILDIEKEIKLCGNNGLGGK